MFRYIYCYLLRHLMSHVSGSASVTASRRWVFTLNNYTDDEVASIKLIPHHFLLFGRECAPATGTPHLQGYVVFSSARRFNAVKKAFPPRAHIEPAAGSTSQNVAYCSKSGHVYESGTRPADRQSVSAAGHAARSCQWASAVSSAKLGRIDDIPPKLFAAHYRTWLAIRKDYMAKPLDAPDVTGVWIYGPPGVGKSFVARRRYPDAYFKLQNKWWDGYVDQAHVILDDFDCKELGHLLKIWADRYSFIAEIKGGAIHIRPQTFVITSNYSPQELFGHDPTLLDAIKRRFRTSFMPFPVRDLPPVSPESGSAVLPAHPDSPAGDSPDPPEGLEASSLCELTGSHHPSNLSASETPQPTVNSPSPVSHQSPPRPPCPS